MKIAPKQAYELLIPYLEKFKVFNETTTIGYDKCPEYTMIQCFIYPGFMNSTFSVLFLLSCWMPAI